MYTKEQNKKCGRTGYYMWKDEKEESISPKKYDEFINHRRKK